MTLEDALAQMQQLESKGDLKGIIKLRAKIAQAFPNTPEAAESLFRLGLYFLFVENQPQAAMQTLEDAVKTKDPNWSKAARVSLASLHLREGKPQKALLELRKALGEKEPPSIHTVSALSIMEAIHEEAEDHGKVRETKEEKVRHLQSLIASSRATEDDGALAFFLLSLAQERLALNDIPGAKGAANEVVTLGNKGGASNLALAQAFLKTIP
jgi:tetratricopeptide (TPR) repeat protein